MTDDISPVARIEYDAGITPLDYAEGQILILISEADDREVIARRILGALLDAGWQPPVYPIPEPEVPQ